MDEHQALALLGRSSPQRFMRRHWQKKPLLIRQAIPDFVPPLDRRALLDLAASPDVESRLVTTAAPSGERRWQLRHGPFTRRMLPPARQGGWTLLVQGVDLHVDAMHELLQRFRFVPDARLDDVMVSYATDGGGVGPHFDSYDVFLLQAHGRRRWRIGRQKDLSLVPELPLKILARFEPEQEFVLEPGDMLYLPPRWAHDGVAIGENMTISIGFRAPARAELASELLHRLAQETDTDAPACIYRDATQPAVAAPGAIPVALQQFARDAVHAALRDPLALARALGEHLSEPKANVWFDGEASGSLDAGLLLDRRTRMVYDEHHVFINGESYRASGKDARLMRELADRRTLDRRAFAGASDGARELLRQWHEAGWIHGR